MELDCTHCEATWKIGGSGWSYVDRTGRCLRCRKKFDVASLSRLLPADLSPWLSLDATPVELLSAIGPNSIRYCTQWGMLHGEQRRWTWNWSAFVFNYYWMAYRKMYRELVVLTLGGLFLALPMGVALVMAEQAGAAGAAWGNALMNAAIVIVLGGWIALTASANWFYERRIIRLIERARRSIPPGGDVASDLERRGGVSAVGPAILFAINALERAFSSSNA